MAICSFYTHLRQGRRTSDHVNVEVYAQRDPQWRTCVKVTEATLTYVAVDDDRSGIVSLRLKWN